MSDVLLVEDDDAIGDAMASILEELGYDVTWVLDGRAALDALAGGLRPRVILLDLTMPVMDGREFRAEQAKNAEWARIPVIVCTADGRPAESAKALDAAGYLRKPFHPDELLKVIERFVPGETKDR